MMGWRILSQSSHMRFTYGDDSRVGRVSEGRSLNGPQGQHLHRPIRAVVGNSILHLVEEAISGRVGSEAMLAKFSRRCSLTRYGVTLPDCQNSERVG